MTICVHGNVCRAWMARTNSIAPLSTSCPRDCRHYEPKEPVLSKEAADEMASAIKRQCHGMRL